MACILPCMQMQTQTGAQSCGCLARRHTVSLCQLAVLRGGALRGGGGRGGERSDDAAGTEGESTFEHERPVDGAKSGRGQAVVYNHQRHLLTRRSSSDGMLQARAARNALPRHFGAWNASAAVGWNASAAVGWNASAAVLKRRGNSRPRMSRAHSEVTFPSMDSYAYSERTDLGFSLFLDRRCKIVYFIGNAQGLHNLAEAHELLVENGGDRFLDARLTPKGLEECLHLKTEILSSSYPLDIQLIVTSPLTRALQTSIHALSDIPLGPSPASSTRSRAQSRCVSPQPEPLTATDGSITDPSRHFEHLNQPPGMYTAHRVSMRGEALATAALRASAQRRHADVAGSGAGGGRVGWANPYDYSRYDGSFRMDKGDDARPSAPGEARGRDDCGEEDKSSLSQQELVTGAGQKNSNTTMDGGMKMEMTGGTIPIVATELCRERITGLPCDRRRPIQQLKKEFPKVDFTHVLDDEDVLAGRVEEDSELCRKRATRFLQWLCARPEQRIAVVSHSGFLTHLFSQFGMSTHVNMASKDLRELHRRPLHAEMRGVCLAAHRPFNAAEIERGSEHATSLLRDPKLPKDKGEDKDAARRGPPSHEAAATVQMPLPPPQRWDPNQGRKRSPTTL